MTHNIQEGLNELFELILPSAKEFNKRTYAESFKIKYEKFGPLFAEIARECENAADRNAAINEIAEVIPEKMHAILDKAGTKRKKENLLMHYNLGMVVYVIPLFRYGRMEACEAIVDQMVARWNDNGVGMDIGKSTFEEIQSGFKSHFCYITTAVCESLGRPDNCYELNLMREYRDEYLAYQDGGAEIIREYYDVAPTIVKRIDRLENADEVYHDIWEQYLKPCVSLIEQDRKEACREVYMDMVHSLRSKYIYS